MIAVFVVTFLVAGFHDSLGVDGKDATDRRLPCWSTSSATAIADSGITFCPTGKSGAAISSVFHYPVNPAQHFSQARCRIVPRGSRYALINKRVFINGILMQEPFVQYIAPDRQPYRDDFRVPTRRLWRDCAGMAGNARRLVEDKQLIIPEDSYFVLGDNRDDSQDSRYWGFVPREEHHHRAPAADLLVGVQPQQRPRPGSLERG